MPFDNPHRAPFGDLELLIDARSRISGSNRWVQGRFQDGNRRCLVAALSAVAESSKYSRPNRTEHRLSRLLAAQLPSSARFWRTVRCIPARQRLMWFNDRPRTKHEDVIALFDRTIDELASQAPVHASA
jgi:hypothetical protein